MSIVVLGTVALDTVKTPSGCRRGMLGGSAVHFSMSCRLFTQVNLSAIVGKDFPARHLEFLRRRGLNLSSVACENGKTFRWDGEYRGDLNCALTRKTELGVLLSFSPVLTPRQRGIRNIFLANVDPDIQARLLERMARPRLIGLDSMNYWIQTKKKSLRSMLAKTTIYVANEQEARDLSGEHNLLKAARSLRAMGPEMVVIKKGEHGVIFYSDAFICCIPAYPTEKVVDPTGAGDTFAGGFMGYLCRSRRCSQQNVRLALAYGTVAASYNVEGFGVERTCRLGLQDIEKRLARFRSIVRL